MRRLHLLALTSLILPASTSAQPDIQVLWYASRSKVAQFNWLKGEDRCPSGARDCNVCADTIPEQFADALHAGDATWKEKPWDFNWEKPYEPSDLTPSDVFDDADTIQHKHIQGFVRTNSSEFPFAASHADNDLGGILFIHQREDGVKKLASIHEADGPHPSGMHTIGQFVAVTESNDLRFFDVNHPYTEQSLRYANLTEGELGGGGIGLAKLRGGGHLMLTAKNGGSNETFSQFYFVDGSIGNLNRIELLREENSADWRPEFSSDPNAIIAPWLLASENLSLITECGTRDIYAIHATGEDDPIESVGESDAIWRLSRVDWSTSGPHLTPVDHARFTQELGNCHLRSTGTVHPSTDHKLVFYCHERARPERWWDESDSFHFTVGTLEE